MINTRFETARFMKEMGSIVNYAVGFLDGAKAGRKELLETIGKNTIEVLNEFIDSNARTNPDMLHHIYEWYQSGSPSARLFDLECTTYGGGLTFSSTFRQSTTVSRGSNTPFYDKARIMEQGIPVRITPVSAQVLRFEDDNQEVFTKGPVVVKNPGGEETRDGLKRTIDMFFKSYFSQAFLQSSGLSKHLGNPVSFKKRLPRAKRGGRAQGFDVGYRWIAARGVL